MTLGLTHKRFFAFVTLILFFDFAWPRKANAIDIVSMYRGSCSVDSGVIIHVNSREIKYLGFDGMLHELPRYEVVGLATYPIPELPISTVRVAKKLSVPLTQFFTFQRGDIVPLAKGWPIAFNPEHIQVLTVAGEDHLVPRDDIWEVRFSEPPSEWVFKNSSKGNQKFKYLLRHPLSFERCPENVTGSNGEKESVNPQQTLNEPITIKRFFDSLEEAYKKVADYEDRQRFYAVPQYYRNKTLLGTWGMIGSRYTNVGARQVNLLPFVRAELSEGPFGFQRVLLSGVSPLTWGLHEEPNAQVFYGLKADYVHLEVFFDPTAILIGSRYSWSKDQLNTLDDRIVETGGGEFGFDFGWFSLYVVTSGGHLGIRVRDEFIDSSFGLVRVAVLGQYYNHRAILYFGNQSMSLSDGISTELGFAKLRVETPVTSKLKLASQFIRRTLKDDSNPDEAAFIYNNTTDTISVQTDWALDYRWAFYGLFSVEKQKNNGKLKSQSEENGEKIFPKLASGVSIAF